MKLARSLIETLIYGTSGPEEGPRRFTQDSPILPDVWIAYGADPTASQELLLTPHYGYTAGQISVSVRDGVERQRESRHTDESPNLAYNQTYVAVNLYFEELVRVVLPTTRWWTTNVRKAVERLLPESDAARGTQGATLELLKDRQIKKELIAALERDENNDEIEEQGDAPSPISPDLLWMIRIVGAIGWARKQTEKALKKKKKSSTKSKVDHKKVGEHTEPPTASEMIDAIVDLVADVPLVSREGSPMIWQVNRNREAKIAVKRSTLAVKADAARLLFKVQCKRLVWAVIDSGIDARHPAFWKWGERDEQDDGTARRLEKLVGQEELSEENYGKWPEFTRVKATYDFTRARSLLSATNLKESSRPEFVEKTLEAAEPDERPKLERSLEELVERQRRGQRVDWGLAEPFLKVPHDKDYYDPPRNDHGTHVAGILGANWPQETMEGICPDIRLYDMRVIRPGAPNDEFSVLAALQFIKDLNDQKDFFAVHGVNMSLSIRHDVANFACGRTPVCDECERLVDSGVTVVAAAGNEGYLRYMVSGNKTTEGYHTVSITDPGNADKVITVGSTHRYQPHTYGVSYFSSRGPTGDGRIKPDLVAPGEKIESPVPNLNRRTKDGTSMAAPHVSGAAAMLMARHTELVGRPDRIKEVLCQTATDLARERYFQGCGMLDVLRALQSI